MLYLFNRCADKAIEIAGPGFWDSDEVALEVRVKSEGSITMLCVDKDLKF